MEASQTTATIATLSPMSTAQMEAQEPAVKQIMAQMEDFRRGQSEQLLTVVTEVRWVV